MKKLHLSLGIALVLGGIFVASFVYAGSNLVNVTQCNEGSTGVKITRFNRTYTLENGCRDAGHGMRQYTLTCADSDTYRVEWSECEVPVVEDGTFPEPKITIEDKSLNQDSFDYSMSVGASDDISPITEIEVYFSGGEYGNTWTSAYHWKNKNATSKSVIKNFTIESLSYNTSYSAYARVIDASGMSATVSLFDMTEGFVPAECDSVALEDGFYTLCPTQALLHNSTNTFLKNRYVGYYGLYLQVNFSSYIHFSNFGEEKIVVGMGGKQIKVKYNGYDNQGNAFVIISEM